MRAETTEKLSPGPQRLKAANKNKACCGSAEKRCATQNQRQQPVKLVPFPIFRPERVPAIEKPPISPILCGTSKSASTVPAGLRPASIFPALPSLCEDASYAPFGAESLPTCTQGFRPGLHSGAASRLGITIRLPLVVRSLSSHTDPYVPGYLDIASTRLEP